MMLRFLSPIHKAGRQIGLYLEPKMAALGLSTAEAHLVAYLGSYAPCPIRDLHRVFGHRRSTLTSLLDRLEEKGVIERKLHPSDRRSFLLELTRDGREIGNQIRREIESLETRIGRKLSKNDLRGFERVTMAIADATKIEIRRK